MIKDEESSSLTRRYYRCKQSETGVFWGGKGGTCEHLWCTRHRSQRREWGQGRRSSFSPSPLLKRTQFLPESCCLYSCQEDCLLLSPLRARSKTDRSPARKLTIGGTRYGMGRVYGASAFNPLLGFQDIYLY